MDRPEPRGPDVSRRDVAVFAGANAVLIALAFLAGREQFTIAPENSELPRALVGKWVPYALALATAGSIAIAIAAPGTGRAFLVRHFALYAASPLLLFMVRYDPAVLNSQLGAVYLLIPVAFAAHALEGTWRGLRRLGDRRVATLLGITVLLASLMVLPYDRSVYPTASDEPHYLLITQSLLYDHDVDLRNDYDGDRYRVFYPARLPDVHGIGVGAAIYPIRDLGLPLLSTLPFALGGRSGVMALLCLTGALLGAQLYLLLRDLRFGPRDAFLATAATALVHPILTYTTQVYPDLPAALAFVSAVRLLGRGAQMRARHLAGASALVGVLPWLTTRGWLIAVGVGAVVAYWSLRPLFGAITRRTGRSARPQAEPTGRRSSRARLGRIPAAALRIAAGGLPFAAIVGLLAYVNGRMFGLYLPAAGYYLISDQQQVLAYSPLVGGLGLFFDRVFGLVGRAPIYLLAFLGIAALVRRVRSGLMPILAPLFLGWLAYFIYIADIAYWFADGSPPSRYLLASMPFLVAGVAGGFEAARGSGRWRPALEAVAWALAGWSVFVTYLYAVLPETRYDLAASIRATASPGELWVFVGRLLRPAPGSLLPSLVRVDGLSIALSAAWVALAAGLGVLGWIARRPQALHDRDRSGAMRAPADPRVARR